MWCVAQHAWIGDVRRRIAVIPKGIFFPIGTCTSGPFAAENPGQENLS
jgi:hypothetical protein